MNSPIFLLGVGALALVFMVASGRPVVAGTEAPAGMDGAYMPAIHTLQRSVRTTTTPGEAPIRDPFASENPLPAMALEQQAGSPPVPVQVSVPVFPDFRVLGKQQDDEGWAVFIGESGKQGQVWVVRQGESFNERFKVSKLAPPVLVIKSTRGRQSRTFDIGKDEDTEE
ncbi:MAG: hypothetical protein D3M94_00405 [Rhodocyclales bacterium GT-UBC]|nr:MAG: hypothetical protein D3M94_00405 [Rhodocyclales bacterium GT-UBC]